MIAVIRLRGRVGVRRTIAYTLESLRIRRVNHCTVLKDSKQVRGMLEKTRDYTTFGEVDKEVLKEMVEKRGRRTGGKRVDKKEAAKMLKLLGDPKKLVEAGFKPVFRLRPPRKGLKSKKKHFPQGDLGYRGKNINELLERMI